MLGPTHEMGESPVPRGEGGAATSEPCSRLGPRTPLSTSPLNRPGSQPRPLRREEAQTQPSGIHDTAVIEVWQRHGQLTSVNTHIMFHAERPL